MDSSQCNDGCQQRARAAAPGCPQWIHLPELGRVREWTSSGRKRIFAVVSRPIPTEVEGKTIRRVLVFDNHPDTLHLLLESSMDLDSEPAAWRREKAHGNSLWINSDGDARRSNAMAPILVAGAALR